MSKRVEHGPRVRIKKYQDDDSGYAEDDGTLENFSSIPPFQSQSVTATPKDQLPGIAVEPQQLQELTTSEGHPQLPPTSQKNTSTSSKPEGQRELTSIDKRFWYEVENMLSLFTTIPELEILRKFVLHHLESVIAGSSERISRFTVSKYEAAFHNKSFNDFHDITRHLLKSRLVITAHPELRKKSDSEITEQIVLTDIPPLEELGYCYKISETFWAEFNNHVRRGLATEGSRKKSPSNRQKLILLRQYRIILGVLKNLRQSIDDSANRPTSNP